MKNNLLLLGVIIGTIYYYIMKSSIPPSYKNCSFVSNVHSDLIAFMIGGLLVYHGYNNIHNNNLLIVVGIAIITEHILQFSYKI